MQNLQLSMPVGAGRASHLHAQASVSCAVTEKSSTGKLVIVCLQMNCKPGQSLQSLDMSSQKPCNNSRNNMPGMTHKANCTNKLHKILSWPLSFAPDGQAYQGQLVYTGKDGPSGSPVGKEPLAIYFQGPSASSQGYRCLGKIAEQPPQLHPLLLVLVHHCHFACMTTHDFSMYARKALQHRSDHCCLHMHISMYSETALQHEIGHCFPQACICSLHARGAAIWQAMSWPDDAELARLMQMDMPGAVAQPAGYSWAMQLPAWPCASEQRGHTPLRLLLLCFFC